MRFGSDSTDDGSIAAPGEITNGTGEELARGGLAAARADGVSEEEQAETERRRTASAREKEGRITFIGGGHSGHSQFFCKWQIVFFGLTVRFD